MARKHTATSKRSGAKLPTVLLQDVNVVTTKIHKGFLCKNEIS